MSQRQSKRKGPIEIFLSYSTKDKKFAGNFKDELEAFGLRIFLAHEDILPSVQWQETILDNLKRCDVFVPILTRNFSTSLWTDQESGIAFALNRFVLPVGIHNKNPHGFLSRYQALKGEKRSPEILAEQVLKALAQHKPLRNRLRESIIEAFGKSDSFAEAGTISGILLLLSPFSGKQMNMILQQVGSNNQIYNSWDAIDNIEKLIKANRKRVPINLVKQFRKSTSSHRK